MRIGPLKTHLGVCDASAAVSIQAGTTLFVVADDEDQERTRLRVYDAAQDGPPVREHVLDVHALAPDPKEPEIDLEGAAWLGDRIFWTGSHSRSRKGKKRPSRHRLFATVVRDGVPEIAGTPYCNLVEDVARELRLDIDPAASPKQGGLSIEGLSAGSEPGMLWIGLRSPLLDGKSLLIPLLNADRVVDDQAAARFGDPVLLDLGGLGVRSIDYWPDRRSYLILAGPSGEGKGAFGLMRWSGPISSHPETLDAVDFGSLGVDAGAAPEALLVEPQSGCVYILFDEGNRSTGGVKCKDSSEQSFRSISITGL